MTTREGEGFLPDKEGLEGQTLQRRAIGIESLQTLRNWREKLAKERYYRECEIKRVMQEAREAGLLVGGDQCAIPLATFPTFFRVRFYTYQ